MRQRALDAPLEVGLVRPREFTNVIKNNPDLPRAIQLALGLKETFRRLPLSISENERLVGSVTEKFKGAVVYPEVKSDYLIKEIDNFTERPYLQFAITDEEKKELSENILPFWDDNSAYDDCCMRSRMSEETEFLMRNLAMVVQNDFSGANHLGYIDYGNAMKEGFEGIIKQAETAIADLSEKDPEAEEKRIFYKSVIISAEGVILLGARYSQLAQYLAAKSPSEVRRSRLLEIAEITAQVPAKPARTFREAVQAYWLTFIAVGQLDDGMETPLCRADQFLYPYYRRDIDQGLITRDEVLELIEELFIKFSQTAHLVEYAVTKVNDGNATRFTLTIGGTDRDGNDATNDLSYLILEAMDSLRLVSPNLAVRLHPETTDAFVKALAEIMTNGGNVVEVFNDEVIVPGFTRVGISLEDARDYMICGCVQPTPAGMYGPNCSAFMNAPKIFELTLNGGKPIISMMGDEDDRPTPEFNSYEELLDAYKRKLRSVVEHVASAMKVVAEVQHRHLPNPIFSALSEGTIESGKDIKAGGARYNEVGVSLIGLGTIVDSLAAIKEVVFEKKTHSLEEVIDWIKTDFEEYEEERQMLLNHAPKYGNGDPRADEIAKDLVDFMDETLREYSGYRGGPYLLGLHTEAHHVYQGGMVAATPNGRHEGEMLSPGCGPSSGMDREGPTTMMRSVTAVDYTKVAGGGSMNMRFNPTLFGTEDQVDQFASLLRTYFKIGGQHLQITVADAETLREAQKNPNKYENLLVRVTGYSARFIDLSPGTQEEIIQRTEMCVCG
jgi:formate C-acetyltransferase